MGKQKKEIDHGKCLTKVRKQLVKANPAIINAYWDMANIKSNYQDGSRSRFYHTGQRIAVVEQYKKRDGSMATRYVNSFVGHDFCPFCGKRIE